MRSKRGRRVGKQAQTIPSPCSTEDQVTVPTVEKVPSAIWSALNARTRRMEAMQTLVMPSVPVVVNVNDRNMEMG